MPRGIARDHDEKRAALRKGAAAYFAEHGFDRASMAGAARHCGVSKALLYHYYDSKESLLFDILDTHLAELVEVAENAAPGGLEPLIGALLDAYADADAEHKLQLTALRLLPLKTTSFCAKLKGAPAAMRICSRTRSIRVTCSVIGCSTCRRVFISMK